jgi:hypothetical protein
MRYALHSRFQNTPGNTGATHSDRLRALLDPHRRSRQFMAARLVQLAGTRAAGFVLTRQEAAGKWSAATYSMVRTGAEA